MTKDASGNYFQRLHALDITTGAEEFGGPQDIQATFPGTGDSSIGGKVVFDPKQYEERAGLLLVNGVVYTSWASHCDIPPYRGWVVGYNESSLAQASVLNFTPNGSEGSVWASGAGPAADANGNIYFLAANGTFDTSLDVNGFPAKGDYGNGFLKLSTSNNTLAVADYFAMFNTVAESNNDQDLGSGGALVLPDMTDSQGQIKHLAVGAGKDQNIYLVDRDHMGKFNPNDNSNIYQELSGALSGGEFAMPAYFNNTLYYGAVGDSIKAFQFSNAKLSTSLASETSNKFGYPGTTPSISATGTSNGIVWAAENGSTAVLHAYDATDLSRELYNSNQAASSRDHFGTGNKFITPTIANGKVYVGTTNGVGVFGLLNQPIVEETEFLPAASSGPTHRVFFWDGFTDKEGTILDSTTVGDSVTYTINVATAGTYDVKVAVKELNTRAIWQLSINGNDQGSPQDEYAPSATWAEFDLGTVTFSSTGSQTFKFTVKGKNANSQDYKMAFDYIKLTPQ